MSDINVPGFAPFSAEESREHSRMWVEVIEATTDVLGRWKREDVLEVREALAAHKLLIEKLHAHIEASLDHAQNSVLDAV